MKTIPLLSSLLCSLVLCAGCGSAPGEAAASTSDPVVASAIAAHAPHPRTHLACDPDPDCDGPPDLSCVPADRAACRWRLAHESVERLANRSFASQDGLIEFRFHADRTFEELITPACARWRPACELATWIRRGTFVVDDAHAVELTFDDGERRALGAQVNCRDEVRLVDCATGQAFVPVRS